MGKTSTAYPGSNRKVFSHKAKTLQNLSVYEISARLMVKIKFHKISNTRKIWSMIEEANIVWKISPPR